MYSPPWKSLYWLVYDFQCISPALALQSLLLLVAMLLGRHCNSPQEHHTLMHLLMVRHVTRITRQEVALREVAACMKRGCSQVSDYLAAASGPVLMSACLLE